MKTPNPWPKPKYTLKLINVQWRIHHSIFEFPRMMRLAIVATHDDSHLDSAERGGGDGELWV